MSESRVAEYIRNCVKNRNAVELDTVSEFLPGLCEGELRRFVCAVLDDPYVRTLRSDTPGVASKRARSQEQRQRTAQAMREAHARRKAAV